MCLEALGQNFPPLIPKKIGGKKINQEKKKRKKKTHQLPKKKTYIIQCTQPKKSVVKWGPKCSDHS